jgi:hypothetical protein
MSLPPDVGIVSAWADNKSQEDVIIDTLRAQIKEIENAKAAEHMKRVKTEEAESLRKQLRSYGVTPAA